MANPANPVYSVEMKRAPGKAICRTDILRQVLGGRLNGQELDKYWLDLRYFGVQL